MTDTLVNSNVLIDVWSVGSAWAEWSMNAIAAARADGDLVINPIVFAEVCLPFGSLEEAEGAMAPHFFRRDDLPWEAAFVAAKASPVIARAGASGVHRCRTFTSGRTPR